MKLAACRVLNYRPITDSGWVDLSDITVIVGKNESGKTALLRALHKFNPFKAEPYNLDREWPRGRRNERSTDADVVETRFSFTSKEKVDLATIGSAAEAVDGVQISKSYAGTFRFVFLPNDIPEEHPPDQFETVLVEAISGVPPNVSPQMTSAVQAVSAQARDALAAGGARAFHQKHPALVTSIDQAVQPDTDADTTAAGGVKKALAKMHQLAGSASPKSQASALVQKWLPTFIYMDDHKPFSGMAFLDQIKQRKDNGKQTEEDKTVLMIMEMAGLKFEEECTRAGVQDKEQRMLDMNDASLTLTDLMAKHWSQRKYHVRFEADGHHFVAFVSDEIQPSLVPLNERSKGFQWFFSFDMTFLYETRGTFKNAVILLDEPGLHLHAAAQRDLLRRVKEYAKDNQLIYSTHMPFMIDMQRLDNIRVCVESKDKGAVVTSDFYAADEHARFPLQAALGLSISQSLFVGPFNLVVEGITDFWFLSSIAALLRDAGRQSLDERIVITPSGGATKAAYVGTMLQGQDLSVVVLLDSDPEGRNVAEGLIKQWIMKDRHVLLLGNLMARTDDTTIEDLFPLDFYLSYANQAYQPELAGQPVTLDEIAARNASLVTRRIDDVMRARGFAPNSDGWAFNKGRPAKVMLRDWASKVLSDLPQNVFQHFESLFCAVNKAMPGLSNGISGTTA